MTNRGETKAPWKDRWTKEAEEQREYWICECGRKRKNVQVLIDHCEEEHHIAEKVDSETGEVLLRLRAYRYNYKYKGGVPNTAQVRKARNNNKPSKN